MSHTTNLFPVRFVFPRGLARAVLPICAAVVALLAFVRLAPADVKPIDPRFVAVLKDGAPMKCQIGAPFYAVRTLKAGQVLRADGEDSGWLRVEYLPEMLAFIKAADAVPDAESKTVRLVAPSRLTAVSEAGAERGHWWYLLDRELPADSVLQVVESFKGVDGRCYGYLVPAPSQARAWVKADLVRPATAEEIAAYDKGRTDASAPQTANAQTQTPATAPTAAPTPAESAANTAELDALRSRFDTAMTKTDNEAEIQAVADAFSRRIESLGSGPEDRRLRAGLERRLEALKLRQDVLAALKKAHAEPEPVSSIGVR